MVLSPWNLVSEGISSDIRRCNTQPDVPITSYNSYTDTYKFSSNLHQRRTIGNGCWTLCDWYLRRCKWNFVSRAKGAKLTPFPGQNDHVRLFLGICSRLSRSPQISSLDFNCHGLLHAVRWPLRSHQAPSQGCRYSSSRIHGSCLHLPLRWLFPMGLGSCPLDLHLRDSYC